MTSIAPHIRPAKVRIQGALANLHHRVARSTIANILKRHGSERAPGAVRPGNQTGISRNRG
jgi:hypothetical protein